MKQTEFTVCVGVFVILCTDRRFSKFQVNFWQFFLPFFTILSEFPSEFWLFAWGFHNFCSIFGFPIVFDFLRFLLNLQWFQDFWQIIIYLPWFYHSCSLNIPLHLSPQFTTFVHHTILWSDDSVSFTFHHLLIIPVPINMNSIPDQYQHFKKA